MQRESQRWHNKKDDDGEAIEEFIKDIAKMSTTTLETRSTTLVSALLSNMSPKAARTRNRKAKRWTSTLIGTANLRTDDPLRGFT